MATGDTDTETSDRLPRSVVDDVLASERRRLAIEYLAERDEPVVLDDLAAVVHAREQSIPVSEVTAADRRTVRDEFFADHLPKLTATGVVDYDSMIAAVSLPPDAQIVEHLP